MRKQSYKKTTLSQQYLWKNLDIKFFALNIWRYIFGFDELKLPKFQCSACILNTRDIL